MGTPDDPRRMSHDMAVMLPEPGVQPEPVLTPWVPVTLGYGEAVLSAVQAQPAGDTTAGPPAARIETQEDSVQHQQGGSAQSTCLCCS